MSLLVGVAVLLVVLVVIDRILLRLESRGWINYRRHGLSRGGAVYHTLELHSIFDPAVRPVLAVLGPLILCGLSLGLYNVARFGSAATPSTRRSPSRLF